MKRRALAWFMLALLVAFQLSLVALLARPAVAENTTTTFRVTGLPGLKVSAVAATAGDVVSTGTQAHNKVAQVLRFAAGGQKIFVLVRVEKSASGVFIDGIAAATTTALATAITAFDLTIDAPGHPHPTHDAVDDSASTGMVGYADP